MTLDSEDDVEHYECGSCSDGTINGGCGADLATDLLIHFEDPATGAVTSYCLGCADTWKYELRESGLEVVFEREVA